MFNSKVSLGAHFPASLLTNLPVLSGYRKNHCEGGMVAITHRACDFWAAGSDTNTTANTEIQHIIHITQVKSEQFYTLHGCYEIISPVHQTMGC